LNEIKFILANRIPKNLNEIKQSINNAKTSIENKIPIQYKNEIENVYVGVTHTLPAAILARIGFPARVVEMMNIRSEILKLLIKMIIFIMILVFLVKFCDKGIDFVIGKLFDN
jgi:hypothetical protein